MYFENNVYYVSEQHAKNYKALARFSENIRVDLQIRSAAYILSLPNLYEHCDDFFKENTLPVEKILENDSISKQYKVMVQLAADLLYGAESKRFSIAEGLDLWDDDLFRVFMQAVRMRKGVFGPKVN